MKTLQTPLVKTKLDEHDTESGNMFVYKISRYTHIQFLRVTYLRDDSEGGADGGGPSLRAPFLTHKTFVPKCIGETAGDKNFESMSDLMQRIKIWLEATDAVVLCSEWAGPVAERVALTIGVEVTECKGEWYFTRTTGKNKKEVIDQVPRPTKLLYYVRLYLDGEYKDPDIKTKQIQTKEKDEECHIL
ncbi:uncharacterized protein LOC141905848 [Tubulanus polymorphus]|uniref:uncharacterized protein LOC141905848 n=1 Tax=Tubulanus polymorphus TaxID=672921 RepID=UPI003DA6B5E5